MTSELSLLQLLAFQANLAWPWQVAGDASLGGLTPAWLVVYIIGLLLLVRVSPVAVAVDRDLPDRAAVAAWFAGVLVISRGGSPLARW